MPDTCPECGDEYDKRVKLSSRIGRTFDVSEYSTLCQTAEQRTGGGRAMKPTRSDTEKYRFIGYLHK